MLQTLANQLLVATVVTVAFFAVELSRLSHPHPLTRVNETAQGNPLQVLPPYDNAIRDQLESLRASTPKPAMGPISQSTFHSCGLPTQCPFPADFRVFVFDLPPKYNLDLLKRSLLDWPHCGTSIFRAEVALHKLFLDPRIRTENISEADVFFVPLYLGCALQREWRYTPELIVKVVEFLKANYTAVFPSASERILWPMTKTLGIYEAVMYSRSNKSRTAFEYDVAFQAVRNGTFIGHFKLQANTPTGAFASEWSKERDISVPYDIHEELLPYIAMCESSNDQVEECNLSLEQRHAVATFVGTIFSPGEETTPYARLRYLLRTAWESHSLIHVLERNSMTKKDDWLRLSLSSRLVLAPAGSAPQSTRVFESLRYGRVPVILADEWELPFMDRVDYTKFSLRYRTSGADLKRLAHDLELISLEKIAEMEQCTQLAYRVLSWRDGMLEDGDCSVETLLLHQLNRQFSKIHPASVLENIDSGI